MQNEFQKYNFTSFENAKKNILKISQNGKLCNSKIKLMKKANKKSNKQQIKITKKIKNGLYIKEKKRT